MDRYLLKNIIIIILVLVNGFLLASLALRQTSAENARRQAQAQLAALFAADEIRLDPDAISREAPPPPLTLSRDTRQEQAAAAFFLGQGVIREDQGGGTYTYSSDTGVARFRSNGSFDVVASLASDDPEALCRTFCQMFSYDDPVFSQTDADTVTGIAVGRRARLPVFNCTLSFTLEQSAFLTLSGTLLPEEDTIVSESREPLSAAAALIAFHNMCRESGAVVSAVTNMYPCYELQGSTAAALTMAPAWCVVTDTTNYYISCTSGAVLTGWPASTKS